MKKTFLSVAIGALLMGGVVSAAQASLLPQTINDFVAALNAKDYVKADTIVNGLSDIDRENLRNTGQGDQYQRKDYWDQYRPVAETTTMKTLTPAMLTSQHPTDEQHREPTGGQHPTDEHHNPLQTLTPATLTSQHPTGGQHREPTGGQHPTDEQHNPLQTLTPAIEVSQHPTDEQHREPTGGQHPTDEHHNPLQTLTPATLTSQHPTDEQHREPTGGQHPTDEQHNPMQTLTPAIQVSQHPTDEQHKMAEEIPATQADINKLGKYTQSQVSTNSARINGVTQYATENREMIEDANTAISSNSSRIASNEQRLNSFEQDTNKKFGDLKRQVDDNKDDSNAGIAGVAAMATIPQVTDKQDFSIGAGVGARDDQQAIAVGFSARATEHVVTKVAVAADTNSGFTVGAGMSYGW
jgi:autotransporter adhesin